MKDKEKYAKEIIEIACKYGAVNERTGELKGCSEIICEHCLFRKRGISRCKEKMKAWLESEYTEKPVISKRDRIFLEYLRDRWEYMARDNISNIVYAFTEIPEKSKFGHFSYTGEARRISSDFNVVFPMVKWSDKKPWLIEDLKNLEVVDSYE